MAIDHIEYIIKETVNNAANELSNVINIKEKGNRYYAALINVWQRIAKGTNLLRRLNCFSGEALSVLLRLSEK
jgi:hypothetical protein